MSQKVLPLTPGKHQIQQLACNKLEFFELKLMFLCIRHKTIAKYIQILLVLLNISGCIYSITGKSILYNQTDYFKNEVVIFINCLSDVLLVAVNVFTIIGFTRSEFLVDLFLYVNNKDNIIKNQCKIFTSSMIVLRLWPVVPTLLDIYFFGFRIGWNVYQYFLPRDVWYYCLNLTICTFLCMVHKISNSFACINGELEALDLEAEATSNAKLINISNRYNHLCNVLDQFNRHIRTFLAMVLMSTIVNLLYNCTVFIEFGTKPRIINGFQTKTFVLAVQTMYAFSAIHQVAQSALTGESLQDEAERTSTICYSLLTQLNGNLKDNDNPLVKNLNFILDQSKDRKICLHAGGFFQVNWGIIGSVTSTVATYSIVIIQFLLK